MKAEREYIFFCDESDRKGPFFSNFYGGVRVGASELTAVNAALLARKQALGLTSEVKWEKTDATNVERYEKMMRAFFEAVQAHSLAVRVMFTQNVHVPRGLTEAHVADAYYILYYQFLKHAFGLRYLPPHAHAARATQGVRRERPPFRPLLFPAHQRPEPGPAKALPGQRPPGDAPMEVLQIHRGEH